MKLCRECRRKPWPYAIVIIISMFTAFLTWLTLATAGVTPSANRWMSAIAFLGVGGLLLTYMFNCMRRHCREDDHPHSHSH
jgi:uncharacterized membrane-anchored protein